MRKTATALVITLMSSACAVAMPSRPVPVQAVTAQASIVTDAARAHPGLWPRAASPAAMTDRATEAFVTELMSRMTLEEKVGQTIQADIGSIKPEDLLTYPPGTSAPRPTNGSNWPGPSARRRPSGRAPRCR